MAQNQSPWIKHINRTREETRLEGPRESDVVIVGGGIAGISTLYYILKDTNLSVTLLEADRIAHGATGHNAGYVEGKFEQHTETLVSEFGEDMTIDGLKSFDDAWLLLDSIIKETGIPVPYHTFIGYTGYSTLSNILPDLYTVALRKKAGLHIYPFLISKESQLLSLIPEKFHELCAEAPAADILSHLETRRTCFVSAWPKRYGVLNSAQFSEALAHYVLKKYPDRVSIFEHSPVRTVTLKRHKVTADVGGHLVSGKKLVLCTNGFTQFTIEERGRNLIDRSFHNNIKTLVGYMAGYAEQSPKPPVACVFFEPNTPHHDDPYNAEPYFYFNRRYAASAGENDRFVALGGPEMKIDESTSYNKAHEIDDSIMQTLNDFAETTLQNSTNMKPKYLWHGLMGYTASSVRIVGEEPKYKRLLYNLGCNGVGILPSIFGGQKIAQHIRGDKLKKTLFDPDVQLEMLRRRKKKPCEC